MSATLIADTWQTARTNHRCSACEGIIAAGDRYRRQRLVDDDPYVFKCHALCDQLWWFLHGELDLWDDDALDPYDDVRPGLMRFFAALGFAS